MSSSKPQTKTLNGCTVVITRPADSATTMVRQVLARGGIPVRLPGLSLRAVDEVEAARVALRSALTDEEFILFTSPSAVRFAARLLVLETCATVLAVGQGTAHTLRRHGLIPTSPLHQQDSEGLLALPSLQVLKGRRVALIGAPGGRGLLPQILCQRGASVREVHVYRRLPPRLGKRHVQAVQTLPLDTRVLLSSVEALKNLSRALSPALWQKLCATVAVTSSARMAIMVRQTGFVRVWQAPSARPNDLLTTASQTFLPTGNTTVTHFASM